MSRVRFHFDTNQLAPVACDLFDRLPLIDNGSAGPKGVDLILSSVRSSGAQHREIFAARRRAASS
jgi:hypothetical protein